VHIDSVELIYFSPTGTTRQVLTATAEGVAVAGLHHRDLTLPDAARLTSASRTVPERMLALIGVPVYAGRVPPVAIERLQGLRGARQPAVLVVVYGNRAYEDALLELYDVTTELAFVPIAGAAFIGEHSYSSAATPIAAGRPDDNDLRRARAFGAQIADRLRMSADLTPLAAPEIPGNRPYRAGWKTSDAAASTRTELCTLCGRCADVCPVAAIAIHDEVHTDALRCIPCTACVKACPTGARILDDEHILRIAEWLNTNYSERRDPEIYW
jgi:ferredoxin